MRGACLGLWTLLLPLLVPAARFPEYIETFRPVHYGGTINRAMAEQATVQAPILNGTGLGTSKHGGMGASRWTKLGIGLRETMQILPPHPAALPAPTSKKATRFLWPGEFCSGELQKIFR